MVNVFDTEPEVGLVLHDFCRIDERNFPYPGPVDTYGPSKLSSQQLPQEIKKHSIEVFMQPYPRAWCGCMMAYRRCFNDLVLPIFPGKGHDDWILKILAPITETRFVSQALVNYRMHQKNTNRRDLEEHTLKYFLSRFMKKLYLAVNGYNKKNFYKEIIKRLICSKRNIIHPNLIKCYVKYV
jgi:hypothetical protein